MPVYVFSDEIFEALASTGPGTGGEIQLTDAIQRLAVAGKKVIGVLLQGDELMLDLGSPETMIEALKLSLRYADEKGQAAPEAAKRPLIPRPPRRRAAEIGSLRDPDASLPTLVPLMIEWRTGFGQSWRELSHTPTYQVPIVLGAFVALIVGILTYLFDASKAGAIVAATAAEAYLVVFGIVGLIGYAVSKQNVQNGSIVAMIAGLAIVVLVATQLGLFAGLLLLAGAIWSLASTR